MTQIKPLKRYLDLADPQTQPRYTGIPTFFRTPYTQDLVGVDVGLIGVPFDGGVTNRSGTRHGPREVRNQSSLLRKISATGVAPFHELIVRDLGDAWIEEPFNLEAALEEIATFFRRVVAAGVTPVSVGGDHSISLPIQPFAAGRPAPVGGGGAAGSEARHPDRHPRHDERSGGVVAVFQRERHARADHGRVP